MANEENSLFPRMTKESEKGQVTVTCFTCGRIGHKAFEYRINLGC